jgi:quinol monooxygenase YgiN
LGTTFIRIDRHRVAASRRRAFVAAAMARADACLAANAGCLRFDVIEDMDEPGAFLLCQMYEDRRAYRRLTRRAAGPKPTLSLFATNCYPSDRAMRPPAGNPAGKLGHYGECLHLGIWQIQPQHREAFLRRMTADAGDSVRHEQGCYRFDLLQDTRRRNCFYLYQIYENAKWHDVDHVATPHVKKLLGHPQWPTWPAKRPEFPMGTITDTGLSFLVRGKVVWPA